MLCWPFIATDLIEAEAVCNYFQAHFNSAHFTGEGTPESWCIQVKPRRTFLWAVWLISGPQHLLQEEPLALSRFYLGSLLENLSEFALWCNLWNDASVSCFISAPPPTTSEQSVQMLTLVLSLSPPPPAHMYILLTWNHQCFLCRGNVRVPNLH